ncbi:MAG: hypothetical protein R3C40_10305 [Parvularculaceae bacterium]
MTGGNCKNGWQADELQTLSGDEALIKFESQWFFLATIQNGVSKIASALGYVCRRRLFVVLRGWIISTLWSIRTCAIARPG